MSQQLLLLDVRCPNCQAALTDGEHVVLGARVAGTQQEGVVRLSAMFGDYNIETDLPIGDGDVTEFSCPTCERSLTIDSRCKLCDASMASLNLAGGGSIEFCGRRGCRGHALGGFGDLDEMIDLLNRMFKIPHD
ncbi:MAG TPA: hypothetical protein VGK32_08325 [Vicinamibacterales bacterium]|jgi:hypothetical protein